MKGEEKRRNEVKKSFIRRRERKNYKRRVG